MTTATQSAGQAQKAAAQAFADKWRGIGVLTVIKNLAL